MVDQNSNEYVLDFTQQIGLLVVIASGFDSSLSDLLSECFYLSATQQNVLLRPLSTRAKLDILQRLARHVHGNKDPKTKKIVAWSEAVKSKFNDRNTLVHGVPGFWDGEIRMRVYSAGNAFSGDPEAWPKEKVTDLHLAINDAAKEIESEIRPYFETWIQAAREYHVSHFDGPRSPAQRAGKE